MKTEIEHLRYAILAKATPNKVIVKTVEGNRGVLPSDYFTEAVIVSNGLAHVSQIKSLGMEIYPFGGKTVVTLTDENGNKAVGESYCYINEIFSRKKGIEIAMGRAKKKLTKLTNQL